MYKLLIIILNFILIESKIWLQQEPIMMCPIGTYRDSGFRIGGCKKCPCGTYSDRIGLTSCTNKCPIHLMNTF